MPDLADTPDKATVRRQLRQRPALPRDAGQEALFLLAVLLARQAAAETMQLDAPSPNRSSADARTPRPACPIAAKAKGGLR
jgi:hypothetical protein